MTAKRANLFGNVARMSSTPLAPRGLQCHVAFAPQRGQTQAKTDPRHRGHEGGGGTWAFLAVRGQKNYPPKNAFFPTQTAFEPIETVFDAVLRCFWAFLSFCGALAGLGVGRP
jgi:hypothetical protein